MQLTKTNKNGHANRSKLTIDNNILCSSKFLSPEKFTSSTEDNWYLLCVLTEIWLLLDKGGSYSSGTAAFDFPVANAKYKKLDFNSCEAHYNMASMASNYCTCEKIIKSLSDHREYRAIILENGIKIFLIRDQCALRSAAAMSVKAGSLLDPSELPGLSHLCQCMVMAGNVDSKDELTFSEFLDIYGGKYSSAVQSDSVTFAFDIPSTMMNPALQRFAQCICYPSFPEEKLPDVLDEIESEYKARSENEEERRSQVIMAISEENRPYSRFACGNRFSLWDKPIEQGVNVFEKVKRFYENFYAPNEMSLVVLDPKGLDEIQREVALLFSRLQPKHGLQNIKSPGDSSGKYDLPRSIELVPIYSRTKSLLLLFPIPDCTQFYKTGAIPYLRYIFGYEGPTSLITSLKSLHWIKNVEVGYEQPVPGTAFLTIDFEVTREGIENIDNIIQKFFQLVKIHRKHGPERKIWEDLRKTNEVKFLFPSRESELTCVENLVTLVPLVPADEVLCCRHIFVEYKPDLITDLLELIVPTNLLFVASCAGYQSVANQVEQWYWMRFRQLKIDYGLIQKWTLSPSADELSIPPPNPFIANDFLIKPKHADEIEGSEVPLKIVDDEFSHVWHLQDCKEPRATIALQIRSHISGAAAIEEYNLIKLIAKIVQSYLSEFGSSADEAGLTYNVDASLQGLMLTVHGYNQKLHLLFNYVLNRVFHFLSFGSVGPNYENLKCEYKEELRDMTLEDPCHRVAEYIEQFFNDQAWSPEELLQAINEADTSPARLVEFSHKFFTSVTLDWLFHGNYTKKEALKIYQTSMEYFHCVQCKPLPRAPPGLSRKPPLSAGTTTIQKTQSASAKSVTAKTVFGSAHQSAAPRDVVLMEMVEHLLYEPISEILPERRNLLVWTDVVRANDSVALLIVVEGQEGTSFIQRQIDNLLVSVSKQIKSMSRKEFLDHRLSVGFKKAEIQPRNLWEASIQIFHEILKGTLEFQRHRNEMLHIQNIEHEELVKYYDDWINPRSPNWKCLYLELASLKSTNNYNRGSTPNCLYYSDFGQQCVSTMWCDGKNRKRKRTVATNASSEKPLTTATEDKPTGECSTGAKLHSPQSSSNGRQGSRPYRRGPSLNVSRKLARTASSKSRHRQGLRSNLRTASALSSGESRADSYELSNDKCDADCQTIRMWSREAVKKIQILNDFKTYLRSEIKKTEPLAEIASTAKVCTITMEDALRTVAGDSAANQSESLAEVVKQQPSHPQIEYDVYTLRSIQRDPQDKSSKRSLRKRGASKTLQNRASSRILQNALKPQPGKYFNSLQPTLSHFMRRMERTKSALAKASNAALPTHDSKKSETLLKTDKSSTTTMSTERQQHKLGSRKGSKFSIHSMASGKSKKIFPSLPKNEQVAKIEELDLDIQEEITRLQKMRKLLNAKAKRILQQEESSSRTSSLRNKKRAEPGYDTLTSRKRQSLSLSEGRDDEVGHRQISVSTKLARKVEKTVRKAKKGLGNGTGDKKQTDCLLEYIKHNVCEKEAKSTVFKLSEKQLKVDNTGSSTGAGAPNPEERTTAAASFQPPVSGPDHCDSEKQDSTDDPFRHQDLIQWLQGMFNKEKEESEMGAKSESVREYEIAPDAPSIHPTMKLADPETFKFTNGPTEVGQARLEISKLPHTADSAWVQGVEPNSKNISAASSKPRVIMKAVMPKPKHSSPIVSTNSSTAKPFSKVSGKLHPQQIITKNGISPKFPLKTKNDLGKPPFNLSTKVSSTPSGQKTGKSPNSKLKLLQSSKDPVVLTSVIRERSKSPVSSRNTSRQYENKESIEIISSGSPLSTMIKESNSFTHMALPSASISPMYSKHGEIKRTMSDAEVDKLKRPPTTMMRATSSERDILGANMSVEKEQQPILTRQLSFIGTVISDAGSRSMRSHTSKLNKLEATTHRKTKSRRSSSSIRSTTERKRSGKDLAQSRRTAKKQFRKDTSPFKANKETKPSASRKRKSSRGESTFHVSSNERISNRRRAGGGETIPSDSASLKSLPRKAFGSKISKLIKRSQKTNKKRRHSSRESNISGYKSPPSPDAGLGGLERLKISGYDVIGSKKSKAQTWETLIVKHDEDQQRNGSHPLMAHSHSKNAEKRTSLLSNIRDFSQGLEVPGGILINGGQEFQVNISQQLLTDLKHLCRNMRISPVKQILNSDLKKSSEMNDGADLSRAL